LLKTHRLGKNFVKSCVVKWVIYLYLTCRYEYEYVLWCKTAFNIFLRHRD
jgi:hypothetical protein